MMIGLALLTLPARADQLEKLLMPGPLAHAHEDLEDQCSKCHDRANRPRQRQLCLDCHDKVAEDVAAKSGFHGRAAPTAQCSACHTEHKGRKTNIVAFAPEAFNHARTDFALQGAHTSVACVSCHKPEKKYREAPNACIDCHRDDDVHSGKLGKECDKCHNAERFKDSKFDHAKTKFPLLNAHAEVACVACHRDPSYKGAPGRCVDCHAQDDRHHGARGPACGDCHGTRRWKQTIFNHEKAADFPLLGRHARIGCDTCHRGGDLKAELPRECDGCHAAVDRHAGRFGNKCADCHGHDEWKIAAYDHEQHAKFALRGAHAKLDCHACHRGVVKQQKMAKDCFGCHEVDDVHRGSMGRDCHTCHQESGWRDQVRFDHDLTKFPLVGLHVSVPCEECHASRAFRDAPERCVDCHKAKDVHKGRLKDDCAACHNPNGWDFWIFDHGTTRFPLTGAHKKLGCRDCHRKPDHDLRQSSECGACHRADDAHDGQFGRDCGRCHGTESFQQALTH